MSRTGAAAQRQLSSISTKLDNISSRVGIPRTLAILLGLGAACLAIAGTREMKDIVAPVFFSINLVLAASPVSSWLNKRGVPRWLSAIVAGLLVFAFLIGFFLSIYWAIASLISELPRYTPQFESFYAQIVHLLNRFGVTTTQITSQLQSINPQSIVGAAGGVLANLSNAGSILIVILVVLFFLIFDSISFDKRLKIADSSHPRFTEALVAFADGVRRYWVVTTVFGLIVAILNTGLMVALAVPLPIVWGVFSFVTNYIPNIGFLLGVIPPTLMALLARGPLIALIVLIGFSVLNFVIQSLIQPKFAGDAVGVTPTVSFVSLLFWTNVLGPLGALLALPATLLVKAIFIDADPGARWVNAFIASDPDTAYAKTPKESFEGDDDSGEDEDADDGHAVEDDTRDKRNPQDKDATSGKDKNVPGGKDRDQDEDE